MRMASPVKVLASIILLAGLSTAQAADVPKLDVERMCRESANADPTIDYSAKRCIDSEYQARDELAKKWQNFSASERQECTGVATMGGTASYVELITCLEMDQAVRQERAKAKIDSKPSSLKPQ
jgi:hypothetical protein